MYCVLEFVVTCNDISVIYVTAQMCRRTEKEVVTTVGLPRRDVGVEYVLSTPLRVVRGD